MHFEYSDKVKSWQQTIAAFMDEHIYPNEHRFDEEAAAGRGQLLPPP